MTIDRRKKGCPNPECSQRIKKKFFGLDDRFCPKCGEKLIYVCVKCYSQIEDIGPKHRICKKCEIEKQEKKEDKKNNAKKTAEAAGVAAAGVVIKKGAPKAAEFVKKVINKRKG